MSSFLPMSFPAIFRRTSDIASNFFRQTPSKLPDIQGKEIIHHKAYSSIIVSLSIRRCHRLSVVMPPPDLSGAGRCYRPVRRYHRLIPQILGSETTQSGDTTVQPYGFIHNGLYEIASGQIEGYVVRPAIYSA
ncbi:hypothetical protein C4D60_Mb10t01080 [Musa balbisiana]|uniref:Uncharacterized protein n=1 Tax=Musa balbisiana TaxID=52838 RepID=A0A4S8IWA2_MUSBA|nr:hypothetical protein C4D60_Mb10t01080 [Musa balbisiana]